MTNKRVEPLNFENYEEVTARVTDVYEGQSKSGRDFCKITCEVLSGSHKGDLHAFFKPNYGKAQEKFEATFGTDASGMVGATFKAKVQPQSFYNFEQVESDSTPSSEEVEIPF